MLGSQDPYPSSPVCCIFLADPRQSCRDKEKAQNTKTVRSEYGGTSFDSFRIRSRIRKVKTAPTLESPVRFLPTAPSDIPEQAQWECLWEAGTVHTHGRGEGADANPRDVQQQ